MAWGEKIISLWTYLKARWFQVCLLFLCLFLVFKREIKFNWNNLKAKTEKPTLAKSRPHYTETTPKMASDEAPLSISPLSAPNNADVLPPLDETIKMAYLKRFVRLAQEEQKRFGVPASLILAVALRQSHAGTRPLATTHNNHFAMVCDGKWVGGVITENGQCYRQYDKAWSSFRDFSLLLQTEKWVGLKQNALQDYKSWARGLAAKGFAPHNSRFAEDITAIIEQYQLNRFVAIE